MSARAGSARTAERSAETPAATAAAVAAVVDCLITRLSHIGIDVAMVRTRAGTSATISVALADARDVPVAGMHLGLRRTGRHRGRPARSRRLTATDGRRWTVRVTGRQPDKKTRRQR